MNCSVFYTQDKGYENRSFQVALLTAAHVITPLTVSSRVDQVDSKSTRRGFSDMVMYRACGAESN